MGTGSQVKVPGPAYRQWVLGAGSQVEGPGSCIPRMDLRSRVPGLGTYFCGMPIKTHSGAKRRIFFVFQVTKNYNLFDKNVRKTTSNAIFNLKKIDLDES